MKFKLQFDCDNAAFEPQAGEEIARILRAVANNVETQDAKMIGGAIFDANGNKIGKFEVTE